MNTDTYYVGKIIEPFFLCRLYKTEQRGAKILLEAEISLLFDIDTYLDAPVIE